MSLTSALSSSVSALKAQSTAISAVAQNIANASTTSYKNRTVSFQSLVAGSSGGVITTSGQAVSSQGTITSSSVKTNIAISGNGFFVVSDSLANKPSAYNYSRNGSFATDKNGYLINSEGYYLLGQATDANGNVLAANKTDLNSLQPINVDAIKGAAKATTAVEMNLNLPADAEAGDTFTSAIEIFDSLGVSHTVNMTWTKTDSNEWLATLDDPYQTNKDSSVAAGTISPGTLSVSFNGDGSLASYSPSPLELSITGFTSGSNDSLITLDIGSIGGTDGLTQYSSNTAVPDIEIDSITGDGVRYGKLSSIEIAGSGIVTAVFENGLRQPVYQIPVATFANPNGLTHVNGSVYDENEQAGTYVLQNPGAGSAGSVVAEALEESGTDTSTEFNKMIVSQQAYSAASQVISTVNEMYDTLMQAVR